ncbi:PD40 domain-containing protein [Pontibacter arcticus]|uniref:WD40-like Beta Propeller Repeat n=1 Tax=Pontibacter arcticus TaxID=2080288 RepID=A0A364REC5_9BACT|nr:PD40 domain-containing protein [Pontibacter arcticus]RAU82624.1 hypothetical protein DP923_09610 [Pontibacter arcticus]
MRFPVRLLFLGMLLAGAATSGQAQPGRDTFGKSRIQYQSFDWKLYSTQNFNVYFYKGGDKTAQNAAAYAEQELKRITSLIGYYPYAKVTLILYNSPSDLKQSNIGLDNDLYQTGGETLFMKNKVELAFEGTQTDFKRKVSYKLTELLMNDMMYGGSLKEALQSSYLLKLPDWFISGTAAYTSEGWSIGMDNFMRDMLLNDTDKRIEKYMLRDAEKTGQSIWNYIAERYGYTAIQNILNLTRITRDVEIGITSSLNIPYKRFIQDWHNYYTQINTRTDNPLTALPENAKLFRKNKHDRSYTEPVLNPAGTLLAYAENDNGKYKIIVQEVKTKRSRIVWKGGYKSMDQLIDYTVPVLAWRNNGQLGFVESRRGQMTLRQVSARNHVSMIPLLENLMTASATLKDFSLVRDMSYSPDGQTIVISGVQAGQSDLYLLRPNGALLRQLTDDVFDDIQPVFLKDGSIVFSSNRWVDEAGKPGTATFSSLVNNYDIFQVQPQTQPAVYTQLTSTISSEFRPRAQADGSFTYIGEESGIRSIYKYDFANSNSVAVSGFAQSIEQYDYNAETNTLAFTAQDKGRSFVYLLPGFAATSLAELPKTSRQIILETRARTAQNAVTAATTRALLAEQQKKQDTTRTRAEVNIENYQFDGDNGNEPEEPKPKPAVRRAGAVAAASQLSGPLDYDLRFSMQEITTSVYADPMLGFGLVAGVNMSDLFENHHIRGSAFLRTDLETSRFAAEYMNLKNRVDLGMQFNRDIILSPDDETGAIYRLSKNEFSPVLVYPLSYSTSLRVKPKFVNTRSTIVNSLATPDSVTNFGGGNVELVYDNSVATGVNMLEGTRFKVGLLSLKGFEDSDLNFNKFYVDFRHYQKLHRQIVLATRISYGAFFGNSPKRFLIGGMDNWLIANEDEESDINDIVIQSPADLFYLQYVTPLRGFNFNARNGDKHLMANAELRIPIVQYLFNGAIPSGFFRNLQLTAFADAGSAYSGSNPFTGRNSFSTRVVGGRTSPTQNDPFEVIVTNYRNPFLIGYGFGARTTLLGVYGKLDVAWGEEDYKRNGPKFYLTLGYDF